MRLPPFSGWARLHLSARSRKKTCTKGKTIKWYNNGPDVEIAKNRQVYVDLTENLHDQPVKKNHPIDPNPAGNLTRDQRAESIAATW